MRLYNVVNCILMLGALFLAACSSGSGGGGTTHVSNLITNTYSDVTSQAAKAAGNVSTSSIAIPGVDRITLFGAAWSTTPTVNNPVSGGQATVLEYVGIQLTPELQNSNGASVNVFGRLNTALGILCAVGVVTGLNGISTDSAGYPAVGTYSLTFTTAAASLIATQCNMDVDGVEGETVQLTVANSGGIYDRSFDIDGIQMYFVKATSSEVKIATGEVHDGGNGQSRTMVSWDKSTKVMTVEYVSARAGGSGPTGLYGYRLFYDETNDEAQILTYEGDDTDLNNSIRYVMSGKPETGTEMSLSLRDQNLNGGSITNGCIDIATGALNNDGNLCAGFTNGLGGVGGTLFSDFLTAEDDTTWSTVSATSAMNWSDVTDMLSAAFDSTL